MEEKETTENNESEAFQEKSIAKKITSSVVSAVLGVCVVFCLIIMAQVLSRGYASIAGYSMFRVVTGSMEPAIPVGSLLMSQKTNIEEIEERDIICFRSKEQGMFGQIITHRVVGILNDENGNILLRTRGDANISEDGYYVTKDNIVGKVIWHTGDESIMATIFSVLTNKIGFLSIIVIPVLVVAGLILRENMKSIQKELAKAERELKLRKSINEKKAEPVTDGPATEDALTKEEYDEMYERIKAELMEELIESATDGSVSEEETCETENENDGKSSETACQ